MASKKSSPTVKKATQTKTASAQKKSAKAKKKAAAPSKQKASPEQPLIANMAMAAAPEFALAVAPPTAPAPAPAAATLVPGTPAECLIWIGQSFHIRVLLAISDWSLEPVTTLTATMTLGALAKGTPWGAGQQARLVNATNGRVVFFPFASTMLPPGVLLPATTTVAQWEKVVFRQQDPKTPCFVFGG